MLNLGATHLIVKEAIFNRFKNSVKEPVDVRVADFDDTQYFVHAEKDSDLLTVSVNSRGFNDVVSKFSDLIKDVYGDYVVAPASGFQVTLAVHMDQLPESIEEKEALAEKLAQVKRNVGGAPLVAHFRALSKGELITEPFVFKYRSAEHIFIIPNKDGVVVIHHLCFKDQTDAAIARVFLQEYNETKRVKTVSSAPSVLYTPAPPVEIETNPELLAHIRPDDKTRVGFLSFGISARHVDPEHINATVTQMLQFRAFLLYHIKCSKSQMHTRMRLRVNGLLQVLNRAVPEGPKDKKTASGRTFRVATGGAAGL